VEELFRGQKFEVASKENIANVGLFTLVSAGFF